jgi:hypothetical protein
MAKYFSKFPFINYSVNGSDGVILRDIMIRIKMSDSILNNTLLYYKYDIQEGDTPEIIAEKYYGDAEKHWLVLMSNSIMDPFYEWPLTYQQFLSFINDKYGSQAAALSTIHHYEKIVTSFDNLSNITTTNVYNIDLTAYNSMQAEPMTVSKSFSNGRAVTVTTSRRIVDSYEYENTLNESRRKIQLLNDSFAYRAEQELNRLLGIIEL